MDSREPGLCRRVVGAGRAIGDERCAVLAPLIAAARWARRAGAHNRQVRQLDGLVSLVQSRLSVAPHVAAPGLSALAEVRAQVRERRLWEAIRPHLAVMLRQRGP